MSIAGKAPVLFDRLDAHHEFATHWMAANSAQLLTVADFTVYRINGRKRFELELLH